MDQGLITNPKDLERMQHELESLERRISSLEDDELEVMEKLEEAQAELAKLEGMVAETDERLAALAAARDEKLAAIDEQLPSVQAERGPAVEGLPDDLLALYDRLREQKGGVGAAALRARQCGGCRLSIDAVELGRIKRSGRGRGGPLRGVPAHPGPHLRVGAVTTRVVIEADGGSRGNPGPAAYGAVLRDADTGAVIAEDGSTIGVASNNVAEYSGLIAGLRLAREHAPDAEVEVRMDSKLVVEQMSGRWKIKHDDMRRLAAEAAALAPAGTTYTWVPREQNKPADRLANEALDGKRGGVTVAGAPPAGDAEARAGLVAAGHADHRRAGAPRRHVAHRRQALLRRAGQRQPGPQRRGPRPDPRDRRLARTDRREGRRGRRVARTPHDGVRRDPRRRARPRGRGRAGLRRDGVRRVGRADLRRGGGAARRRAHGLARVAGRRARRHGESFRVVQERVLDGLGRVLEKHAGKTVVVVSHVTPIKTIVAHALDAPLESVFRMELTPASITSCPGTTAAPRCGCSTPCRRATTSSPPAPRGGSGRAWPTYAWGWARHDGLRLTAAPWAARPR